MMSTSGKTKDDSHGVGGDESSKNKELPEESIIQKLHLAAEDGKADEVRQLCQKMKDKRDVNIRDTEGMAALVIAVKNKNKKVVEELLKPELKPYLDLYLPDKTGRTALHWAAQNYEAEIMKLLLDAGDSTNASRNSPKDPPRDEEASDPTNAPNNTTKLTAKEEDLRLNVDLQDSEDRTPLYTAVESRSVDAVRYLLKSGADRFIPDNTGRVPLLVAALTGEKNIVGLIRGEQDTARSKGPLLTYLLLPNSESTGKPAVPLKLGTVVTDIRTMQRQSMEDRALSGELPEDIYLSGFKVTLKDSKTGRFGPWAKSLGSRLLREERSNLKEEDTMTVGRVKDQIFYPDRDYLAKRVEDRNAKFGVFYIVTGMRIAQEVSVTRSNATGADPDPAQSDRNAGAEGGGQVVLGPKEIVLAVCLWRVFHNFRLFSKGSAGFRGRPYIRGSIETP